MRATGDVMSVAVYTNQNAPLITLATMPPAIQFLALGFIQPGQSVNLKENKSEFRIQKRTLTT